MPQILLNCSYEPQNCSSSQFFHEAQCLTEWNVSNSCAFVPLSGDGGSGVQGKLPHHALFQVLLLPLGHVGLQSQDPLLLLPQVLHQHCGVVLRRDHSTALGASLSLGGIKKTWKVRQKEWGRQKRGRRICCFIQVFHEEESYFL